MYFKLDLTVRELLLSDEAPYSFEVSCLHNVHLILEKEAPAKSATNIQTSRIASCTASVAVEPPKDALQIFDKIERNGYAKSNPSCRYTSPNGGEIWLPTLGEFPEHFREFISSTRSELSDAANHVVGLIRWRLGVLGPAYPFSSRGLHWSRDGEHWHHAPSTLETFLEINSPIRIGQLERDDINRYLSDKLLAPVHHEMFREAWDIRMQNPRSSIVIAVAALEIALKKIVINIRPKAKIRWKPIKKLYSKYLPTLIDNRYKDLITPESKTFVNDLVDLRNDIVHQGYPAPRGKDLVDYLQKIRQILCVLDCISGHEWAQPERE